jgi:hypothetical protein
MKFYLKFDYEKNKNNCENKIKTMYFKNNYSSKEMLA